LTQIPIVVLNWNGIDDTIECIESLLDLQCSDYHIFLIDNGSNNNQGQELQNRYNKNSKITVTLYPENLGFAKAHIKIWDDRLKNLNVPYIALINNDTFVDQNWLTSNISFAQIYDVDIVSSKMIDYYRRDLMDNAGHQMLNTGEIIPIGFSMPIENFEAPFPNIGACGGAALYSKSMLEEIGFFDPYFDTGYEDAELGLRAIISGFKCMFNPNAIVFHKRGVSIKKVFNIEYSIKIQTNILYSYFKLIPFFNIILSTPSIIFKNFSIVIIDIVFFRWHYLYIWYKSCVNIITNFSLIRQKRSDFYHQNNITIGTYEFSRLLKYFFYFDMKRFWNTIVLKRETALDNY